MLKKIFAIVILFSINVVAQSTNIHHELKVTLNPSKAFIEVVDEITVKSEILKENLIFKINDKLNVELLSNNLNIKLIREAISSNDIGMDREDEEVSEGVLLNEYAISGFDTGEDLKFILMYSGKIESPIEQSEENYQRGFSESPGIISDLGIYLAGSTYWIPTVEDEFVTFNLTTELPSVWRTVSQGRRTEDLIKDEVHIDTWMSPTPQEEIFLIAAKFNEYKFSVGSVDAYAFLRTPDEALANKYLETTAQYLEMYRKLVGPFPYSKFALVENFWETGYGMPSFTLLGEKIIRFPFILHSSYPHELLHNWWGNSVYVDFENGNWCEGLTAYMADHLVKEQRGQATEYRRSTLQKFTDYVNSDNDFPLSKFLSRTDGPSEAIGYGKTLMFFHMLRLKVGDDNFIKAFQSFNRSNKFKVASYSEIKKAFEDVTDEDLGLFFNQWIKQKGAPEIQLENAAVEKKNGLYNLNFTLKQIQSEEPFNVDVPFVIIDDKGVHKQKVVIKDRVNKYSFSVKDEPLKILIDPEFDIMRKLDVRETPSAFTKAYGSKKSLLILPNQNDSNFVLYKEFVDGWIRNKEENFEVKNEDDVNFLPNDRTIWVLGDKNKFVSTFSNSIVKYDSNIGEDSIRLGNKSIPKVNNSFFVAVENQQNINQVVLFLSIGNNGAVPGLLRKLPHYGKYSYLAFEGDEPTNIEKGQWPIINSPLIKTFKKSSENKPIVFENREPLAKLAPAFSSDRMMSHINYLSSDLMKGRGLGSEELDNAANFIARKFEEYGLKPGSDDGTYFQKFSKAFHAKGSVEIKNIIGIIPGTNSNLTEAVVISAHYDHLGLGWPDVRKGNEGMIHNGADDNASGVSVMLELAKSLGKSFKPGRTIIFVAFSAEEAGLVGSKYFVENYKKFSSRKILANLNFDTVGRLFENKLMIINGNTAREWKFIFMGTEYTTGISTELITQELDASDQVSFINEGIPAIQFFSGPNTDYHKPSDIAENIDPDGLVKVATVAKEVIQYLSEREELMNFTGSVKKEGAQRPKPSGDNTGRRVSTGTMPDFAYSGDGVKVGSVAEESPGAKAGLLKGDIIKKLNGETIKSLRDYSNLLKKYSPGDEVTFEVERNTEILNLKLILIER